MIVFHLLENIDQTAILIICGEHTKT